MDMFNKYSYIACIKEVSHWQGKQKLELSLRYQLFIVFSERTFANTRLSDGFRNFINIKPDQTTYLTSVTLKSTWPKLSSKIG